MYKYLIYVPLVALLAAAVPVAENEKRQNAEFDYVIIGVCLLNHRSWLSPKFMLIFC